MCFSYTYTLNVWLFALYLILTGTFRTLQRGGHRLPLWLDQEADGSEEIRAPKLDWLEVRTVCCQVILGDACERTFVETEKSEYIDLSISIIFSEPRGY